MLRKSNSYKSSESVKATNADKQKHFEISKRG